MRTGDSREGCLVLRNSVTPRTGEDTCAFASVRAIRRFAHCSRAASPGPFRKRESDIFFPSRWILRSRRFRFFFFFPSRARLTPSLGLRERVGPRLPRRHVDFACAPSTFWRRALAKSAPTSRLPTPGLRAEQRSGVEKRASPAVCDLQSLRQRHRKRLQNLPQRASAGDVCSAAAPPRCLAEEYGAAATRRLVRGFIDGGSVC